jgi:hypothetical protein
MFKTLTNKIMKKILFISSLILATVFFACKPEEPTPVTKIVKVPGPTVVLDTVQPLVIIRDISLYIPENKNSTDYKFYNISTQTYSNDINSKIELAFIYNTEDKTFMHLLGSNKNSYIVQKNGIVTSNPEKITFYDLREGHSSVVYDTLRDTRSIRPYFTSVGKGNIMSQSPVAGAVKSQINGWDKDEIFGFQLPNGKFGLIKLQVKPSIILSPTGEAKYGFITFDIKMEK